MSLKEKFRALRALIERLVPVDLLIRALPLFLMLLGLAVYAASFWIASQSPWHDAFKGVGQAILAGGVVSAVLNSMTYIGIFRDAVHDVIYSTQYIDVFRDAVYDVIYSPEYLKTRKDLPELWNRVSMAIHEDKFPKLSPHLKENIIKWYLPVQKDFYYFDYDRECFFEWADKGKKLARLAETIDFTLFAASAKLIQWPLRYSAPSYLPEQFRRTTITEILINGKRVEVSLQDRPWTDSLGGAGRQYFADIPLEGNTEYHIKRSTERVISLIHDPILEFISGQFLLKTRLRVRSPSDLDILFVSATLEPFDPQTTIHWRIDVEYPGLIFPGQGYTLIVRER